MYLLGFCYELDECSRKIVIVTFFSLETDLVKIITVIILLD